MTEILSQSDLDALMAWPTPAISNAIELFDIRPRNEGFMLPEIQCRYPDMKPMIGYAATGVITARSSEGRRISPPDWWEEVQKIPAPRIVVQHDIDNPVVGSFWGEVNANMHKAPQGVHNFLRAYYHHKSADWVENKPYRLEAWSAPGERSSTPPRA